MSAANDVGSALDVALRVAAAFDAVDAPYFLGGSLASSLQGEPRATNDIDFVVSMVPSDVSRFAGALGSDFDVDTDALRTAIAHRDCCNLFFLPMVTKIDVFALGSGEYDQSEFSRRRAVQVRPTGEQLVVKAPEDTVLRKLLWYRAGGEVSSKQWRDVVEVLRVSRDVLDVAILDAWADRLGIRPMLARARVEAMSR